MMKKLYDFSRWLVSGVVKAPRRIVEAAFEDHMLFFALYMWCVIFPGGVLLSLGVCKWPPVVLVWILVLAYSIYHYTVVLDKPIFLSDPRCSGGEQ